MDYKYNGQSNEYYEDKIEAEAQKTYTVKYIGVVEGSMGILSRKMRMPKVTEASIYEKREWETQGDGLSLDYKLLEKNQDLFVPL